jgi:hypothetical protein
MILRCGTGPMQTGVGFRRIIPKYVFINFPGHRSLLFSKVCYKQKLIIGENQQPQDDAAN